MQCVFCHFENEDGSFFCEQCKADLGVEGATTATPPADPKALGGKPLAGKMQVAPPPAVEAMFNFAGTSALPGADSPCAEHESPFAFLTAPAPAAQGPALPQAGLPSTVANEPSATLPVNSPKAAAAPVPTKSQPAKRGAVRPLKKGPTLPAVVAPPAAKPAAAGLASAPAGFPAGAQPHLVVLRGRKINALYPLYEGQNYIGRADEKAVDIDLEDQEPPDRVWSSREHAIVHFENGMLTLEDLNSRNGTFLNRDRIPAGQRVALKVGDVIQVGTVQMKVTVS